MLEQFKTGDWYHYRTLPEHEKKIYMHLYEGICKQRHTLEFPVERHNGVYPPAKRVVDIMLHMVWDNPRLYYFDATNATYYYKSRKGEKIFRLEFTDYFSSEEMPMIQRTLLMRSEEILKGAECLESDYARMRYIHEYLTRNVKYMYSIQKTNTLKNLEARTIIGPLLNHLGVCAGYTKAFKLLCDQLGIGCFYIRGYALVDGVWGNHGWNAVYLDGQFYHVDITHDSELYHVKGRTEPTYFLRSDQFMARNHKWDRMHFPAMPNDRLEP